MTTLKKIVDLIAAASKAGYASATKWDLGNELCLEDHRLRSLMNFERDVVKSTADDRDALPQWRAFLEAFDKKASYGHDHISINGKRGKRFRGAVAEAMDANQSLGVLARTFPQQDMTDDDVQPKLIVEAMTRTVGDRLSLVYAMLDREEEPAKEEDDE